MNYKDIIAQARRLGFQPYAGNESQQQVKVGDLEVSPYLEWTGQPDLDGGSSQQIGYTISTPMGGSAYRTDVVDMNGNVLRSNVHDAESDKYGLQDMAKLALAAAGANAGGLLGGAETEAGSALSSAGLSTAPVDSSAAWFNPVVAPDLAASLPSVNAAADVAGTGLLNDGVQQIVINGSGLKPVVGPGLLTSAVVPGVLAATAAVNTLTGGNTTDTSNYFNEGRNPTDRANMGPDAQTVPTVNVQPGPLDGLKAWAVANPELAKLLFSGAGALLNTAGGGGGNGGGGYVDSGYRPTISRGGFDAAPQAKRMEAQPTGLLMTPGTGQPDSGLWRYSGLLNGPAAPTTPTMTPPTVTAPTMRATPPTTVRPAVAPAPTTTPTVKPAAATNAAAAWKPGGMASWLQTDTTPVEKAVAYNAYRANNMSDAEIRAMADKTFGKQTDTDWAALQRLASPLPKDLLPVGKSFTDQQLKAVALPYAQPSAQPTAPPVVQPAADAPIGVPYQSVAQRLKNYVYEGGASDDEATRRGLGYARLMGWSPDEAVRNWNDALGTKFTTDDYQRAMQAYGFTSGGLLGG